MNQHAITELSLKSAEDTEKLAQFLAQKVKIGDTVLLSGGIGAGKTHLARALIQSLLLEPEDIPSPTFTLVQTYETAKGELWHADLYRLSDTSELVELGLEEAFDNAICLIEWPDRLGDMTPDEALHITLTPGEEDETRQALLTAQTNRWDILKDFQIK